MNDNVQNGEVIIDINDLSKAFGDLKVLTNISTQIRKGDVVCVIGPSGSGKSTFLRCMNLLETPTGGHIYFEGTDITDPKTNIDKLRQKMGMVFQQFNLFPHMTILDNTDAGTDETARTPEGRGGDGGIETSGACRH